MKQNDVMEFIKTVNSTFKDYTINFFIIPLIIIFLFKIYREFYKIYIICRYKNIRMFRQARKKRLLKCSFFFSLITSLVLFIKCIWTINIESILKFIVIIFLIHFIFFYIICMIYELTYKIVPEKFSILVTYIIYIALNKIPVKFYGINKVFNLEVYSTDGIFTLVYNIVLYILFLISLIVINIIIDNKKSLYKIK